MKKLLTIICLLLTAVSAVRAQAQLVSGPTTITGRIGNANLPLGAQLYDNAGTPIIAADFGARTLKAPDGREMMSYSDPTTLYFLDGAFIIVDAGIADSSAVPVSKSHHPPLIANDGSTVALDWSDPTSLDLLYVATFSSGEKRYFNADR
jgi:hypothetical protein